MIVGAFVILHSIDAAPQSAPHGYDAYEMPSSPVPHGYADYVTSTVKAPLHGYEAYDTIQQANDAPHGYESYGNIDTKPRPNGY